VSGEGMTLGAFTRPPGSTADVLIELVRDDGGTFDAVSFDVVSMSGIPGSECTCGGEAYVVSDLGGSAALELGTMTLTGPEWVGISSLSISVSST